MNLVSFALFSLKRRTQRGCELAVMETGIGGRFDSTNALGVPEVSVITKIGFDHTAVLGNTLAEIAGEKAGIIKIGAPVVTQMQEAEAMKVKENVNNKVKLRLQHYLSRPINREC